MAIDPDPTPGLHLFSKTAKKAHAHVIRTYAGMLYSEPENAGYAALDVPVIGHRNRHADTLRMAIRDFYQAAAADMQADMDRPARIHHPDVYVALRERKNE